MGSRRQRNIRDRHPTYETARHLRRTHHAADGDPSDGELGLEPFSTSSSTISAFTREERERRRDEGELETMPVQARLDDLQHRLVELAEHAADELEEAETFDIGRLRQLIGVVKNLNSPSLNPGSGRTSPGDRAANLLERLAAQNTGNGDGDSYFDEDQDDDED